MRFVIQRVTEATCEVDQKITGQITNGFCVLIGIAETDTKNIADKMIRKLLGMRIFGDESSNMVKGPSFTREIFISAPKIPVCTSGISSLHFAIIYS